MIIVYMLNCGMANQLFIYTYARYLCDKYHKKLMVYYSPKQRHHSFYEACLANYKLSIDRIINYRQMTRLSKGKNIRYLTLLLWNKIVHKPFDAHIYIEHKFGKKLSESGIIINHDIDCAEDYLYHVSRDRVWVSGYFQIPFFAYEIRSRLLSEVVPVCPLADKYQRLTAYICGSNSVCVHIRCGDYIGSKKHYVCTERYYREAIKRINKQIRNPVYFIFSDDIEYVRNKMNLFCSEEALYVSDETLHDYEELYVMKHCKNFIISNSTFSWWAQFLSESPNKIVIAPNRWYGVENMTGKLFDASWEIIECA